MKQKTYLVGNWKSYKTAAEITAWFVAAAPSLTAQLHHLDKRSVEIILCVPSVYLALASDAVSRHRLPIKLAAQNVSRYSFGAYTGEVTAVQLQSYAAYTLIGHSERRTLFLETDEDISEKSARATEAGITQIVCVSAVDMRLPETATIIAYEPLAAIGTGNADTPKNANMVAAKLKEQHHVLAVLYGGSVTPDNVTSFVSQPDIDGVLVGKASLDPASFCSIIVHACQH